MNIHQKHILHIEAVNNAKTNERHATLNLYLAAWKAGIEDAGQHIDLCAADMFYLDQGIDRPMCGGVWLDWEPEKMVGVNND